MSTEPTLGTNLLDVLRSVKEFAEMPGASLDALALEMRSLLLTDSETLIRQGEMGATLCVVASGVLRVTWVDDAGVERTLPDVLPGGTVGEVSVLSDTPALATVRAHG